MADTTISTSHPSVPKIVMGVIAAMAEKKSYFRKFRGEGMDAIIQVIPNLRKEAGDQVTVQLRNKITGDGITGDSDLEGNEVAMTFGNMSVKIGARRQAVRLAGRMTEKASAIKLRKSAADGLSTWKAEVEDEETFYHLACLRGTRAGTLSTGVSFANAFPTPDAAHLLAANSKTFATLTTADTLSCADIDRLVETQRLSDDLHSVQVDGMEVVGALVISPEQATWLRKDADWKNAQLHANVDGLKNPIFTGMMGIYNGVVVHVHRNIPKFATAGAGGNVVGCRAIFLCAQAGVYIPVDNGVPAYVEKDFDYDNKTGFAVGLTHGIRGSSYKDSAGANETLFGRLLLDTAI